MLTNKKGEIIKLKSLIEDSLIFKNSYSLSLVTLPYGYLSSESCPWQLFNRIEKGTMNSKNPIYRVERRLKESKYEI